MTEPPKDAFDAIEYPCDYKFKAVCKTANGLQQELLREVNACLVDQRVSRLGERPSRNGKFTAVTFEIRIENRDQLEKVYSVLAANEHVVMTL